MMLRTFILVGILIAAAAGCRSSDDLPPDNSLPPAANKEEGEARASASAPGFNRTSDAN
ncbi:MAG TPA: hypothetical protein VM328_11760 [Fimbriimonadaceae bacterium]|nr:hypothetical protein [Fimbriimonadaceae bacterium]